MRCLKTIGRPSSRMETRRSRRGASRSVFSVLASGRLGHTTWASILLLAVLLPAAGAGSSEKHTETPVAVPASGYSTGVVGGQHDLTESFGFAGACNSCHVPHVQAVRTTTRPATQPAVELFRVGGQRRVFEPDRFMPGPTSLLCLGCHDGTIATSTIGTSHALLAGLREGFAVPEGFVWRDHPIGIAYPAGKRGFQPRVFVEKKGVRLPEGRIECVSCHDPHNSGGFDHLLVMSNRRSALCLTCHIK
ncbi:MAG: cytochrome c3 family protein [Phycisphaerae bacterium]